MFAELKEGLVPLLQKIAKKPEPDRSLFKGTYPKNLQQELSAFYSEDPERELTPGEIMTCYGHVLRGFEYPMLKYGSPGTKLKCIIKARRLNFLRCIYTAKTII